MGRWSKVSNKLQTRGTHTKDINEKTSTTKKTSKSTGVLEIERRLTLGCAYYRGCIEPYEFMHAAMLPVIPQAPRREDGE